MSPRALVALAFVLGALVVRSHDAYLEARQDQAILDDRLETYAADVEDQYVDLAVLLRVVTADPHGELIARGKPRVRELRRYTLGGLYDRKTNTLRPCTPTLVWLASEEQEEILLTRSPPAQLVEGSEGSGKTTVLAKWHYVQWLRHLGEGREGLQTAPTNIRLGLVKREIRKLWRPEWYRVVTRKDFAGLELCDGCSIRMVSTHKQSADGGSPIQGFNASWAGRDETQDQTKAHEDIEARGREARDGIYPQLGTATMKDSTDYRDLKARMLAEGEWAHRRLLVCKRTKPAPSTDFEMVTPFVSRTFVESKRRVMSIREFCRRFFAEDQMPELAVFYAWMRSRNLVDLPDIGALNVTAKILSGYQSYMRPGARFTLAGGHDPGSIYNTTEFGRLVVAAGVVQWVIVGELQTRQTTAKQHALLVREYVQDVFGLEKADTSKVAMFVDPHGRGDGKTDYSTHYGAFQEVGIDVFNPAPTVGTIYRGPRIDMTNRLLGDAAIAPDVARLVVAKARAVTKAWDTESGTWTVIGPGETCAPKLVEAFEQLKKRPGEDDPEGHHAKNETDKTHAPAATGYMLWPFEQQALTEHTQREALREARRLRV